MFFAFSVFSVVAECGLNEHIFSVTFLSFFFNFSVYIVFKI